MERYSYDRRNELLVTEPIQFPSGSKPGKMNTFWPGTVLDPIKHENGLIIYQPSGWFATIPMESLPDDSVLDLHEFFKGVAREMGGSFVPPQRHRVFGLIGDKVIITVYFDSSKHNWAEVVPEAGDDFEVDLKIEDFKSPQAFLRKVS